MADGRAGGGRRAGGGEGGGRTGGSYLIPSEARDLAGEWLEPFPRKVPRFARDEVLPNRSQYWSFVPYRSFRYIRIATGAATGRDLISA